MRQNFEPQIWGPNAWFFLESVAMGYSTDPTYEEKKAAENFFESLEHMNLMKSIGIEPSGTDLTGLIHFEKRKNGNCSIATSKNLFRMLLSNHQTNV